MPYFTVAVGCGSSNAAHSSNMTSSDRFRVGDYCVTKWEGAWSPCVVREVVNAGYMVQFVEDAADDIHFATEDESIDIPEYKAGQKLVGLWEGAWHACTLVKDGPDDCYVVHFNDDAAGDNTEIEQWKLQAV